MTRHVFFLLISLLISACNTTPVTSTLTEEKLIGNRNGYEIDVFDYNPTTHEIYFVEVTTDASAENPSGVLSKYDPTTRVRTDVFSDFHSSYVQTHWFQLADNGSLFLFDNGGVVFNEDSIVRTARILEFENDSLIGTIPVLTGMRIDQKANIPPGELKDLKKRRTCACEELLEGSESYEPIGANEIHKVRFSSTTEIAPKFILLKYGDESFALDVHDCGSDLFLKYKDQYSKNHILTANQKVVKRSVSTIHFGVGYLDRKI